MKYCWLIIGLLSSGMAWSQIGGNSTYEFLRIPNAARVTALGGSLITVRDADLSLAYHNPAALNPSMHRRIVLNQSVYMGGITHGYLAYGHHIKSSKLPLTVHGGLQYISYGEFQNADVTGADMGTTSAAEYAINIGSGLQVSEYLSLGLNAKTILSYLGGFNSTGMALDAAAMFVDTAKNISLSLVFKNMGTQFSTYNRDGNLEPLPFDLQIGFAHKLKYIPLRFSVIMHNIQRWGIVYDDPSRQDQQLLISNGAPAPENTAGKVVDDIFRHLIFNIEFLFGKKGKPEVFRVAAGYNHMRRGELGISTLNNLSGFSFGCAIRIKQFQLDYGFGSYHVAGAAHHFGLSINLNQLLLNGRKKKS